MRLLPAVHPRAVVARQQWLAQAAPMRIIVSVLLLLLCIPDWTRDGRLPLLGKDPAITITAVSLDAAHPDVRRIGDLVFLGGVQLSSHDPAFGGFSSLHVAGERFTLLSDGGNIVRFGLDSRWRLSEPSFAELPAGPGTGWEKEDRDSESMSVDPRSGAVWVGFENSNDFWEYDPAMTRAVAHVAPPQCRYWPPNEGPEAMALLPGGGMATIAETTPWPHMKGRGGVVFSGNPVAAPQRAFLFNYLPPKGYDPVDMTVLPDGRWLILNRAFTGYAFSSALTLVDPRTLRAGVTVTGRVVGVLAAPMIHDNFEGVAVTREGAATIVWIVSDDNQLWPLQRSLLLKFRLAPAASADAGRQP